MPDIADGLLYYIVFLFSTTLHEAAHAWAAARGGDLTAYHGGQVSLNPIPHIRREPIGMVVLPLLFVVTTGWPLGFASAPYDRQWASRYPRRAAWMALAGPAANFLLMLIAVALVWIGVHTGLIFAPDRVGFGDVADTHAGGLWPGTIHLVGVLFSLNLLLGTFNLLPFPPLDGSGAVPLFLGPESTRRYQDFIWGTPAIGLIGMLVAWRLFDVLFDPIFTASLSLLYPGTSYH
ncbi:MAG TPA: site-2 protease family protein [Gemmatimonadales bacterium]|nr:site-2 protease family protein [Gemmatimonadales bacterium]